jgi:hypothetical protein
MGADFVARSVPRVCECHETAFRANLRITGDRSNAISTNYGNSVEASKGLMSSGKHGRGNKLRRDIPLGPRTYLDDGNSKF